MILQEADEMLYQYAVGAQKVGYVIDLKSISASRFLEYFGEVWIQSACYDKQSFEPMVIGENAIDMFNLFTKTEIKKYCKLLGTEVDFYKYKLVLPFNCARIPLLNKIAQLRTVDESIFFCQSDPNRGNFRFDKALRKPYKGNRYVCGVMTEFKGVKYKCGNALKTEFGKDREVKGVCGEHGEVEVSSEKPAHYKELTDFLASHFQSDYMMGMEADDGLGMLYDNAKKIMSHIDKDINQIKGTHLNWKTMEKYEVTEEEGVNFFLHQCLTGDSTDNIPPCPYSAKTGYGAARAKKLLDKYDTIDCKVKAIWVAYIEAFGNEDALKYLYECADLVGMGYTDSFDYKECIRGRQIMQELINNADRAIYEHAKSQ